MRAFIRQTLEEQISQKNLLNGDVPEDLKNDIEVTLTARAGSMFLYASLLLEQILTKITMTIPPVFGKSWKPSPGT